MRNKLLDRLSEIKSLPQITLDSVAQKLRGEGLLVLCLIAILPFMQPIPIPGFSSILGMIVLFQGLGLIFGGKPFLTKKMKEVTISQERFELIYKAAEKFTNYAAKISLLKHPWAGSELVSRICGCAIIFSAAFLSLPLPIPFSNFVPAMSIAFICTGLLEEDLLLIIVGLGISLTVLWMSVYSYHLIHEQLKNYVPFF
jgi:hypothetical protein